MKQTENIDWNQQKNSNVNNEQQNFLSSQMQNGIFPKNSKAPKKISQNNIPTNNKSSKNIRRKSQTGGANNKERVVVKFIINHFMFIIKIAINLESLHDHNRTV